MDLRVRELNDNGIALFRQFLDRARQGASEDRPVGLLADDHCTTPVPGAETVDTSLRFRTKLELGRYLSTRIGMLVDDYSVRQNVGIWTWLAVCYLDLTAPPRTDGTRAVGSDERHILSVMPRRHYRHLIRTSCLLYRLHGDDARVALLGAVHQHGEAAEQLLSRQELFAHKPFFQAASELYVSGSGPDDWQVKRGTRSKDGPGTMRRLGKVLRQFYLTYDVPVMNHLQILQLLPSEFNGFKDTR